MLTYYILFIFGLGIGSFINVVTMRYKEEGSVFGSHIVYGRSHCPKCSRVLSWFDLIPVISYFVLLGKCRTCYAKLSIQYPLIEILTGLIFVSIPYYFFVYQKVIFMDVSTNFLIVYSVIWVMVFLFLLIIGIIDYLKYIVPDELVVLIAVLGIAWLISLALSNNFGTFKGSFMGANAEIFELRNNLWINHLVGFVLGLLLIGTIFFGTKGRAIGFGDVKLFGALGILFGYPDILLVFFLSFITGAIVSLPLLIRKLKGMKDYVPFAPFIILASFSVYYFGSDIMRIYFQVINDNIIIF